MKNSVLSEDCSAMLKSLNLSELFPDPTFFLMQKRFRLDVTHVWRNRHSDTNERSDRN